MFAKGRTAAVGRLSALCFATLLTGSVPLQAQQPTAILPAEIPLDVKAI